MRSAHTVDQVRTAEAAALAALPDGALMQRAAAGLANAVLDLLGSAYGRRVLVLAGAGNNGGDALFAGALLARRGCAVQAVFTEPDRAHAGGHAALLAGGGRPVSVAEAALPEVVVDGIVGIGGSGPLRGVGLAALERFSASAWVAVDVPSGIEVDSGEVRGPHVRADVTLTFGTYKVAHFVDPASAACGAVHLIDLGLDLPPATVESLQASDVSQVLSPPAGDAHKYARGVIGLRTGSKEFPGAGVLSVAGALSGLAGMVRYDGSAGTAVRAANPEVVGAGQAQAWVVGSGSGADAASALAACLEDQVPVVVDADALFPLADVLADFSAGGGRADRLILTPHAGELARLMGCARGEVESAPLTWVRRASDTFGAVVLLKGRRTLIAEPGGAGRVRANATGTPWLATAGSGDVLAGLIGSLLASGTDPFDAASVGAWLHGAAGTLAAAGGPLVARDLAAALPVVMAELLDETIRG